MNLPKISFFDDPKIELWIHHPIPKTEPLFSAELIKISKKGVPKTSIFQLVDEKLVQAIKKKYIMLSNMTLEKTQGFGFRLVRNRKFVDLQAQDEKAFQTWYELLKLHCIQRGFNNMYSINKLIGRGNFAKVYSAMKKNDNMIYAVKAFDKLKFADIKVDKAALIKELSIMRIMDFKGVIKLYEVYENDSYIFLVCELLEGGELFNHLKGRAYDEILVAQIMYRMLESIDYIHSRGVLHRDIKPENLILRQKNDLTDVVIADFGLADFYSPIGEYMFKRCGTPGYVAPELLQDKLYDHKVDIFSAGVLMFIMLTGQAPFNGKSYDDIVMKNYECEIDRTLLTKQKISPEALQLLNSLLEKDPDFRISAELSLQHGWFKKQPNSQLYLHGPYPRYKSSNKQSLYARTPLMNQELNQSLSSTPVSQHTPQQSVVRGKSNTADLASESQQQFQNVTFRTPSNTVKVKKQNSIIAEESDYNIIDEDDHQGNVIRLYQIQPKLKKQNEEYNAKDAKQVRDFLQSKIL